MVDPSHMHTIPMHMNTQMIADLGKGHHIKMAREEGSSVLVAKEELNPKSKPQAKISKTFFER